MQQVLGWEGAMCLLGLADRVQLVWQSFGVPQVQPCLAAVGGAGGASSADATCTAEVGEVGAAIFCSSWYDIMIAELSSCGFAVLL